MTILAHIIALLIGAVIFYFLGYWSGVKDEQSRTCVAQSEAADWRMKCEIETCEVEELERMWSK